MPKVSVFLSVQFEEGEYNLPPEVIELLKKFSDSNPTTFYLAWPAELIPKIGWEITTPRLVADIDRLEVKKLDCLYSSKHGLIVYIKTNRWNPSKFGMAQLLSCAWEDSRVETRHMQSLQEILLYSGLPEIQEGLRRSWR